MMLGKRKQDVRVVPRTVEKEIEQKIRTADDQRDVFKQYFESTFEPIPDLHFSSSSALEEEHHDGESDCTTESDWNGIEDNSLSDTVEIIEHHTSTTIEVNPPDKLTVKTFMTSKPPLTSTATVTANQSSAKGKGDPNPPSSTDIANLKHDLALQRLLSESHLLRPPTASTKSPQSSKAETISRHKTVDLRLQALGSKVPLLTQATKMPMSHRQGILAKAAERERKRTSEARENGVVLERVNRAREKNGGAVKKRERGVGAPTIGKFKDGGTLSISPKDVRSIQGGGGRGRGRGGGKRGRRR